MILIGDPASRAGTYFKKAAEQAEEPVEFIPMPRGAQINAFLPERLKGQWVKLDPPGYRSEDILTLNQRMGEYRQFLGRLERTADLRMLNSPRAIAETLDKKRCKERLMAAGVRVTPVFAGDFPDAAALRREMLSRRKFRVFVKPRYGSGAGGVMAYQLNPAVGKEVLYTSAYDDGTTLVNTKKLRRYDRPEQIHKLLDLILRQGAVAEEWLPKAKFQGKSFDLRVVFQFGEIHFIVARQSSGPVTNLHLNNDALAYDRLNLPAHCLAEIGELCRAAAAPWKELRVAGIDILLTPGSLTPYVIEINAQGDLIYQDIYRDNRIYRAQAAYMKEGAGVE